MPTDNIYTQKEDMLDYMSLRMRTILSYAQAYTEKCRH